MDLLGVGAVHYLPAMARQEQWPDLSAVRRRQMLALLFLLPRRRSGALLRTGTHLVSLSFAVLLQRAQLAGATTGPPKGRLHAAGQCLHRLGRLDGGPKLGSLEPGRSRICYRHRVSPAERSAIHLREPDSDHTVKPDDIATFPGKKYNGNYQDEMGNR